MKRIFRHIIIYIGAVLAVSCHKDDPVKDEPEVTEAERTVIVYAVAENSLADKTYASGRTLNYAQEDSAEMASVVKQIPKDYNLILYIDDNKTPTITHMNAEKGVQVWKQYRQDQDSADSTVMLRTLRDITKAFPAKHYGLVMWSHGSGWIPQKRKTIGLDNNHNTTSDRGTEMEIHSLRWVLEQLPRMDYIMFDACFMQSVEVAYELRQQTDYMIGSPAEIPGTGAPYHRIMEGLVKGDAVQIAEEYYNHYVQNNRGVALSVVDCSKMDFLAEETARVLPHIWQDANDVQTTDIQTFVVRKNGSEKPEIHDIQSAMHKLLNEENYTQWAATLEETVIWKKSTAYWESIYVWPTNKHPLTDAEHYSGLSMFIPQSKYASTGWNTCFQSTSWYKAAGWEQTGW